MWTVLVGVLLVALFLNEAPPVLVALVASLFCGLLLGRLLKGPS